MKVLMLSKACVVGTYQKKLEELARQPEVSLTVVVPPYWREGRRRSYLERAYVTGYELRVERVVFNGHFHLHFYPGLGRVVRSLRPDIFHIDEEPYNLATFHALRLGRAMGARCLFFSWQNIYRRLPLPFNLLERYNLSHTDYVVAGSQQAGAVLRRKGYRGPLATIPQFGVDPEVFRPLEGSREAPVDVFKVAYIGRLVEEKGLTVLVRALAGLDGDWQLTLIGDGPLKPEILGLAGCLGCLGRLAFIPAIPSMEVPRYLNRFDALVLPSLTRPNWKEQFGRVLIEAMACRVPVVGSDSGEIPNIIGEGGLICREGDDRDLRDKLATLQGDTELRRRLGRLGRQRVLELYTQAKVAAATYQVYRALLS